MPNKYYVVLCDGAVQTTEMTFPVKATHNEYDGQEQFAGGYPAMFGGTDKGGGVSPTLITEVAEESRRTLQAAQPFNHYFTGQAPHQDLSFYWTVNWGSTGTPWGAPNDRDEGEMARVATVSLELFSDEDPPDTVLEKLIDASGATGGTPQQRDQFFQSETAAAFVQFVYDNVPVDAI